MNLLQKWILGQKLVNQINELKFISDPAIHHAIRYKVGTDGKIVNPVDNKSVYINEGYNKNDIVYSVINKILNKAVLPEWGLYKVVDEVKLKESQRLMLQKHVSFKDIKKAKELKAEAVEPLSKFDTKAGKLKDLLKYANSEYTFADHQR